jgi:hypothetical protein
MDTHSREASEQGRRLGRAREHDRHTALSPEQRGAANRPRALARTFHFHFVIFSRSFVLCAVAFASALSALDPGVHAGAITVLAGHRNFVVHMRCLVTWAWPDQSSCDFFTSKMRGITIRIQQVGARIS